MDVSEFRIRVTKSSKKGFTIVELLVVVAVLALLASIVFSNLGGAREGARISNALSFQSQTHSLLGSDLIGWWNFNEGSGTVVKDSSGYDNHGTIHGDVEWADGVPGTLGRSLMFDGVYGSSTRVETTNSALFQVSGPLTVSAWVRPFYPATDQGRTVVSRYRHFSAEPDTGWNFGQVWTGNYFEFRLHGVSFSSTAYYSGFFTKYLNTWTHVAGVYSPGRYVRLYINGDLVDEIDSNVISGITYTPGDYLMIGRRSGQNQSQFHGLIDDVRIYSRALTASEIQTLYAQTKDNYLANE